MVVVVFPLFSQEKSKTSSSVWPVILEQLNKSPESSSVIYEGGPVLETDLMALYQAEIKGAREAWSKDAEAKKGKSKAELRELENAFYFAELDRKNNEVFERLEKIKDVKSSRPSIDAFKVGEKILSEIRKNPVANLEATTSYDPSGQLGFCFGRALYVHYLLLREGVDRSDIAKVFVAGQLRVSHRLWKFHVAVFVRDPKAGYVVIDPLFEKPMALAEWRKLATAFDIKGTKSRARFYVTDPRKFLPSFGRYHTSEIESTHLKAYFTDLANTFPK